MYTYIISYLYITHVHVYMYFLYMYSPSIFLLLVNLSPPSFSSSSGCNDELAAINDVYRQRLDMLSRKDNDAYQAVMWLKENMDKFRRPVYEPILTLVRGISNLFILSPSLSLSLFVFLSH